MKSLVIMGARGHGRMWRSLWAHGVEVFLDRDPTLHGQLVDGVTVAGGHELVDDYPTHPVALGIGTNSERKRLYEELTARGFLIVDFRHSSAIVNTGAQIGKNVILNTGCLIEHDCVIGHHAHICPGAVLCGGVTVGEGAVIGAHATVKDGIRIGAWATVGCGAVVVKEVLPGLTVVGNPAQFMAKPDFDQDGFVIMKRLWDPLPLEWALTAYLSREAARLKGRAVNYTEGVVNSLHGLQDAQLTRVLQSEQLIQLASTLLGETAVPRAVECFAKPAEVGLPSPWHQDNAYWCLEPPAAGLTIWIALDPCEATNGGLTYLPRSQGWGDLPHEPSGAPGSSQQVKEWYLHGFTRITPALFPGDALIHHCQTIHGSAANTSGRPRRAITFQYQAASATVNQQRLASYETSLAEQIRGRA